MGVPLGDRVAGRLAGRLPTVLVDAVREGFPSVGVDYFDGGRQAGELLKNLGHQRVATVMGAAVTVPEEAPGWQRLAGFRSVFGDDAVRPVIVDRQSGGGADAWQALYGQESAVGDSPTAVFAEWDLLAVRLMAAAHDHGVAVPGGLSVIGFDDDPTSAAIGLTTVTQPLEQTGALGLRLLRRVMSGEVLTEPNLTLGLELAVRQSTGTVPAQPLAGS
jgi:LacI family transcriptional regulator